MNIWSRLGISVALVSVFSIAAAELLQPTLFYQQYKSTVCATFLMSGVLLFGVGRWLNHKSKARYLDTQAQLLAEDRDNDPRHWEPFLLGNLAYWGVMIVIFGCIVVFIVPTYNKREKAKVTARAAKATPHKAPVAAKAQASVPTNRPVELPPFHLQGIILRGADPSALINGRTYFVGDMVQDAKLVDLHTNAAVLEWRGIKVVLPAPK